MTQDSENLNRKQLGRRIFIGVVAAAVVALLAILIAIIAFIAGWIAGGSRFNYVGLQLAFAFLLVAFEGFSAPTELAPARDRFVGILFAIIVMWFVFDQLWPVRTVTAMRWALGNVLRSGASLLLLINNVKQREEFSGKRRACATG
jgi:multidrug resistance protein MdtO